MRLMFGLALAAAFVGPAHCQPTTTTADLKFLTGCWAFEANGRRVEEHWLAPAGGSLHGRQPHRCGRQDRRAYEFLQIRDLPEGVTYIAKPSNQPEARFVLSSKHRRRGRLREPDARLSAADPLSPRRAPLLACANRGHAQRQGPRHRFPVFPNRLHAVRVLLFCGPAACQIGVHRRTDGVAS